MLYCLFCGVFYLKCEGKCNGFYIVLEFGLINRYMICKDGRIIYVDYCKGDEIWGGWIFLYNGKCIYMYVLLIDFFDVGCFLFCKG